MAFTTAMLRSLVGSLGCRLGSRRWSHVSMPAPMDSAIDPMSETLFVLPEFNRESEKKFEIQVPDFSFGGSMDLMAVPKKKVKISFVGREVSPHKRGIRNGPKALKPIPVIIRCKSCGRVKLPHFYCCSGDRGSTGERNDSTI
ncbi:hypothetical protein HHK36_030057 [Tetracentron sinense]|uniref:Large ribosomal subunit protein bL32m n=1 Tax=Tetracentron sinense TaxID=13715 RepID=A0A834YCG0_TETSI|nr:hypothetical protein HHK36_030057 [Tetracentron sinense]